VDKLAYERFLFLGYTYSPITVASFFLVVGAVGKSAQIGLHT
jgi:NADH:ubiquinone oxidoreductase subunit 5 (subunit L)/multisubunit Na+/H+ antiporter MnhA subunit